MADEFALSNATLRASLARSGALRPVRAVAVISQIAAALDAADDEHAIRRDLVSPANIVLAADDVAYLADTSAGALADTGTSTEGLAYLAPERLTRNAPVCAATDVYALACVLFECLTGSPPYPHADDLSAIVAAHTGFPIPRPSQALPSIPAGFDDVIARGLAKDPAGRYASAGELAAAANRALGTPAAGPVSESPAPEYPVDYPDVFPAPVPPTSVSTSAINHRNRKIMIAAVTGGLAVVTAVVVVVAVVRVGPLRRATSRSTSPSTSSAAPAASPFRLRTLPLGKIDPHGVAVDAAGNVYVASEQDCDGSAGPRDQCAVLKWTASTGRITTLPFSRWAYPRGIAVDAVGNVYIVGERQVLKLTVDSTEPSQVLRVLNGKAVAADAAGTVYVLDGERVLKLPVGTTEPISLPLDDKFTPYGIAVDSVGNAYVNGDYDGGYRRWAKAFRFPAGTEDPVGLPQGLVSGNNGLAVDPSGSHLYAASGAACTVSKVATEAPEVTTLLGSGFGDARPYSGPGCPIAVAVDTAGNVYVAIIDPASRTNNEVVELIYG